MSEEIVRAVALLRRGGLVAFPTETVYGLGADAMNPDAVAQIFAIKGRPPDRPLAVLIPEPEHARRWARDIPDTFWRLAREFWPGPLTLVLKRAPGVPDILTAGRDTIGLRIPDHPVALSLLRAFGGGIAAPSANRFGHPSPITAAEVQQAFGEPLLLVLDGGPCRIGVPSTLLDLSGDEPRVLRMGPLLPAQLASKIPL